MSIKRGMEKFKAEEQPVTEREKVDAINQLSKDMTKHFDIQDTIKKIQIHTRTILYVSVILAVLMSSSILYLLLRPPNATEVTLDWVSEQMGNITTQKKLNALDRQDITKAREDLKKMQQNSNTRDSISFKRDSLTYKK